MSLDTGYPLTPAPEDAAKTPAWGLPSSIHRLTDRPVREQAVLAAAHLRARWASGEQIRSEAYLGVLPSLAESPTAVAELAFVEFTLASELGLSPDPENFAWRFPVCAELLRGLITQWLGIAEFSPSPRELGSRESAASSDLLGYEILGELGRGGMGVVYRARHRRLNRLAALKMIHGGAHVGPTQRLRFLAEAQSLARLNHPHIVKVYESGEWDGCAYIALELIEGGNLADRLARERPTIAEAVELLEILAWAVQAAHAAGVVHRDLKPSNILLRPDGTPVITDFGLAKHLDSDAGVTRSGTILGTPAYMAPEQARGSREVGPAADIYSLGVILYECLTGGPPFEGSTIDLVLAQVLHDQPLPPSRIRFDTPSVLEAICLKCLAKDPAERYLTAAELATDLQRFADGGEVKAVVVDREKWFQLWAKRAGFELLGLLGSREGGVVYRARHIRLRREVALKVLTAFPEGRQTALERLERQAAVNAEVTRQYHAAGYATRPPVIEIYDIGERDGLAYCATEYAPGESVAVMLKRVAPASRAIREAAELTYKIAASLATLHTFGFAHGAVSPGNVLLTADGNILFSDLGTDAAPADDVFGLGSLLYMLLTGRAPEPGRDCIPPGRLRLDIPAKLESICLTCLDPNPARRYRQAIDAADALNGFLKEHHLHETPSRSTDRDAPLGFTHVEALRESRFGRVVKARSPEGEDVSLHRIDPGNRLRAADRARLADTFRAAVRLRHPYIQAMIHVLEEGGRVTLVQEYLPGGTLSQRLAAGPLNPVAAAAVVVYVAEAIHHAHQQGIFHGDLDPDNVLFAADGTPRVTDFRLVAEIERRRSGPLTGFLDVQLESRPGYKPPEYLLREPIQLTPAADVYALGALLAEMLMGVPPGDVFGTHQGQPDRNWIGLEQAARKAKRAVSVPRALDAVCRKAMEWNPARRHQTALEFAEHVRGSSPVEKGWFTRLFGG